MRNQGTAGLLVWVLAWAAAGNAVPASAASGANAGGDPATVVARVSVIQGGNVVVTRSDGSSTTATVNSPLLPGDALATTGAQMRAEIQLDGFTNVRLGRGVKARIAANDAHARRLVVTSGLIELAVLRGGDVATEIATPSFTLRSGYAGDYRLSLANDGTATITPLSGQADVVTPRETVTIVPGAALVIHRFAGSVTMQSQSPAATDSFDDFNVERDRVLLTALEDDTHVPASIAGYDNLNTYGRWAGMASYGQVWIPNDQSADWAPYRDGRWSYIGDDGWTWIGSEPWAWVPYHYGRWLYSSGYGWCWYPPPMGFNPMWAPALVGFFGFGDDPSGFSSFGWVPLAPFEAYTPWYPPRHYYPPPAPPAHHHAPTVHMHPLASQFRNARFGGATAVGADAWRNGTFAHPILVQPADRAATMHTIVTGAPQATQPIPIHVGEPVVRVAAPPVPAITPVLHEATPSRTTHSTSPHPPA